MQKKGERDENIFSTKPLPAINERVKQMVDFYANGSVKRFSELIELSNSQKLNRVFNLDKRNNEVPEVSSDILLSIANKFSYVSTDWLLTGRGSMLKGDAGQSEMLLAEPEIQMAEPDMRMAESDIRILHHPRSMEKSVSQQAIKLYDVAAAANLKTLFANKDQNILGEISIPDIPKCDGAIYVRGDSMYPILKSGDIIAYKEIYNFDNVIFGEMYLVSFDWEGDDYLTVKYVNHSEKEEHIKLVSYNQHHDPKDIPLSSINAMAIIKFSIRKNTIM